MKIAEALLLRKQLESKVKQLEPLKTAGQNGVYENKVERRKVSDDIEEVTMQIPKLKLEDITAEYDKYATALRKLDAAVQEANWTNELKSFTDTDNPFKS